jgi:hypothetical protein
MAPTPAILLEVLLNPRVQDMAERLFNSVYSLIFKSGSVAPVPALEKLSDLTSGERVLAERLHGIEQRLADMPTDREMAAAFASLQAEIRLGQRRIWAVLLLFGALNTGLLVFLLYR